MTVFFVTKPLLDRAEESKLLRRLHRRRGDCRFPHFNFLVDLLDDLLIVLLVDRARGNGGVGRRDTRRFRRGLLHCRDDGLLRRRLFVVLLGDDGLLRFRRFVVRVNGRLVGDRLLDVLVGSRSGGQE